jgi:outer membrane lipoprotein-sorting protein
VTKLIVDSLGRLSTITCEIHESQDGSLARRELEGSPGILLTEDGTNQQVWRRHMEVLWAHPNRARLNIVSEPETGSPPMTIVSDGEWLWRYRSGDQTATRQPAARTGTEADEMLRPGWLVTDFSVRVMGTASISHRAVWELDGRPRKGAKSVQARMGRHGLRALLDNESGMLLSLAWLAESGEPFHTRTLTRLVLNAPLSPDLFDFIPLDGVRIVDIE